jgi:LPS export ABC transporter protein LptC
VRAHALLFVLAGVVLLAVAFYLGRAGQAPVKATDDEAPAETGFDYVALGVTVEQSDEQGHPLYAFSAEQVEQHAGDGRMAARGVTLNYDAPDKGAAGQPRRWAVRADEAHLPQQGGVLSLAGNVEARGTPPGSDRTLTVHTSRLDYDMQGERLHTPEFVRFDWDGRELTGIGLDADLRTGLFKLESGVRGRANY